MLKRLVSFVLILPVLVFSVSCSNTKREFSKTAFDYFDTVTIVSGYFNSQNEFDECYEKIEKELERYHKLLDVYNNYEGLSNLKTVNDNAGKREVVVEKEIVELLEFCVQMYHKTDGALNICLAPVTQIWKKSIMEEKLPNNNDLTKANAYTSIDNLVIDSEKSTVFLKDKNSMIDVGSVAKGFVCEKLKQKLVAFGFISGIINLGGNVMTVGKKPDGESFTVGIENPKDINEYLYTLSVSEKCVVTSGDYQRYFVQDGVKYHHIISPKTCYPVTSKISVSVVSDDCLLADAYSTALFVMDLKQALLLVSNTDGVEVLIVDSKNKEHFSNGFKNYLRK